MERPVRGGRDQFSWDNIKGDKVLTSYYFAHTAFLNETWYDKKHKKETKKKKQIKKELQDVRNKEEQARLVLLGIKTQEEIDQENLLKETTEQQDSNQSTNGSSTIQNLLTSALGLGYSSKEKSGSLKGEASLFDRFSKDDKHSRKRKDKSKKNKKKKHKKKKKKHKNKEKEKEKEKEKLKRKHKKKKKKHKNKDKEIQKDKMTTKKRRKNKKKSHSHSHKSKSSKHHHHKKKEKDHQN
ncbi:multiple myeloma tumor-associated protein 2 family member [Anaeramoeba flamelloides]|uniref:Multiple myeloma tumor-associated protein 2 family member n=1 Tax=Anaeramoeba flamelloides TaxID=1746091 RepID=A0AAV8A583_9EUKA|nr:multiple myeloma tumor-associated protein 2 family member [Anaeramoeba flamelloides]